MSIVIEVIAEHLRSNRRLVVPAFGAFVVKETGERLFSDLLNTDDGVLASLLRAKGLSEMEAAVSIDRFIFEVRHELEQYGYCRLGEVGTLRIEPSTKVLRLYPPVEQVELPKQTPYIPKQDESNAKCKMQNAECEKQNAEPTLRSESRGCLHTMPSREEEKPSQEGLMQNAECKMQNAGCKVTSNTSNASAPAHRKSIKPRKKVDLVMVVAVIILLAALAGIGYGWYVANLGIEDDDAAMDALRITPEQIVNE